MLPQVWLHACSVGSSLHAACAFLDMLPHMLACLACVRYTAEQALTGCQAVTHREAALQESHVRSAAQRSLQMHQLQQQVLPAACMTPCVSVSSCNGRIDVRIQDDTTCSSMRSTGRA